MSRPELARRQQHVLRALLAGEVPDGFDATVCRDDDPGPA